MNRSVRRIIIPVFVAGLAFGLVLLMVMRATAPTPPPAAVDPDPTPPTEAPAPPPGSETTPDPGAEEPEAVEPDAPTLPAETFISLRAVAPQPPPADPLQAEPLGTLSPLEGEKLVSFTPVGAGITTVTLSEHWETAKAKHQADAHYEAVKAGDPAPPPRPPDNLRYSIRPGGSLGAVNIPLLAAHSIIVNGVSVDLFFQRDDAGNPVYIWSETGPGRFETIVRTDDDRDILRLTREFVLNGDADITLRQRAENLTEAPLNVVWRQYGPGDLIADRARYMDRRRFRFGYLPDPVNYPSTVLAEDNDLLYERTDVIKLQKKSRAPDVSEPERLEMLRLWPNETSIDKSYVLSWYATTNRYYALAVHPVLDDQGQGSRALTDVVGEIRHQMANPEDSQDAIFTYLISPERTIPAGETLALDLGVYAGPLDRHQLDDPPFAWLGMQGLILYQMSACCAICTFQWLAKLLLLFLSFLRYYVVFDWGMAIVLLVCVVRTILHPITKRAQINMQRFGKVMGKIKPEIDKLQKKYPNDPKKLQQEQLRLMREHGVNPFQMLGCLPMFLQTPIWIALYAMLYFAFELHHQPAFWGIFQWISFGHWAFLADLSAADHFFWEFAEPLHLFANINLTGINALPILMGFVFFVQQKYMSPPPSPTMTPEQIQQQRIMKVMMVVLFPVMLYSAPSGLTLYIFTSSLIGIFESRYIRQHITELELNPPKPKQPKKKKRPKDPQARAYVDRMERMKSERKRGPKKTFKKRR